MTPEELELAKIKASIFNAIISSGSTAQKDKAVETSELVFQWCVSHVAKAKVAPTSTTKK